MNYKEELKMVNASLGQSKPVPRADVQQLIAEAVLAEREACAVFCDQRERDPLDDEAPLVWLRAAQGIRMCSNAMCVAKPAT